MKNERTPEELDALYRDLFHTDARGAAILFDLAARFHRGPPQRFNQDAMVETFARAHQRAVVDYIMTRISRANGAQENNTDD